MNAQDTIDAAAVAVTDAILPRLPERWQRNIRQDLEIGDPLEVIDNTLQGAVVERIKVPRSAVDAATTVFGVLAADSADAHRIRQWLDRIQVA